MKRRILLIVCSCVMLVPCLIGFDWAKTRGITPTPEPSIPGGYYEDAFVLYLDAPPFGQIYYTTDGSEPSANSLRYENGIPIADCSQEPNLYNSIQNIVKDWKTYTPNQNLVEKGTVIRAVYINDWGKESEILTQTYFVGIQPPERGYTLSLVFAYDDLFGENGIYVTGEAYDTWYLGDSASEPEPTPNFEKKLEAVVTAQLLDGAEEILNQPVGLRIQGASARKAAAKRFSITARTEYGGSSIFDTVLYDGVTTHSVMLKSSLPDAITAELVADRAVCVQRSIPVRVYLNGEFWYDSYMLERYDEQYFRQYYQTDDRILVKDGMVEACEDWDAEQYRYSQFMSWIKKTDFSDSDNWAAFQEKADVQSYIDYVAINYFLCNHDFSEKHNYIVWNAPSANGKETEDSRWRWCLYDLDALQWANPQKYGMPETINIFSKEGINNAVVFSALKNNEQFRQWFVLSFLDICNNNFAPEKVERVLATYGCTLDWKDGYFRKRPAYALEHLAEEFALTGDVEIVTISAANPEMGSVVVNTSEIDLTCGSWSGQYFTDYPITVTASAGEGYRFAGWKGDTDTAENSLTLSVAGGVNLEAVFVKEE